MKAYLLVLVISTACSHSKPAASDNDDAVAVDCTADIASDDIKGLLAAPFKTQTLNADSDKNGCSFQAEHYAAVRFYLSTGDEHTIYAMARSSGNMAPLAGVGDKALRGTSAFTKVVAAKGRADCSIELAGVGNVDSEAELVPLSQEIREQKLGAICNKLFAAKKL